METHKLRIGSFFGQEAINGEENIKQPRYQETIRAEIDSGFISIDRERFLKVWRHASGIEAKHRIE